MSILEQVLDHAVLDDAALTEASYTAAANDLEEMFVMMASGPVTVQAAAYCLSQYPLAPYEKNLRVITNLNLTTMATDGINLIVNPTFIRALFNKGFSTEFSTVLCHELAHMMHMHSTMMISIIKSLAMRGIQFPAQLSARLFNTGIDTPADEFSKLSKDSNLQSYISLPFAEAHQEMVQDGLYQILNQLQVMRDEYWSEKDLEGAQEASLSGATYQPKWDKRAFLEDIVPAQVNTMSGYVDLLKRQHTPPKDILTEIFKFIYDEFLKDMPPPPKLVGVSSSDDNEQDGQGIHVILPEEAMKKDPVTGEPTDEIDMSVAKEIIDQIEEKAQQVSEQCSQMIGTQPLGIEIAKPQLDPPRVPLAEKMKQVIPDLQDKSSMRRTHPAFGARRIILPARTHGEPSAIFALDTSGSMGSAEIRECMSEAVGAMRTAGLRRIYFICWDTEAYGPQIVEVGQPFPEEKLDLHGGGGTDATCAYDLAMEKLHNERDIAALVYMTDGYVHCDPKIKDSPWPIIWLFTKNYSYNSVRNLHGEKIVIHSNQELR